MLGGGDNDHRICTITIKADQTVASISFQGFGGGSWFQAHWSSLNYASAGFVVPLRGEIVDKKGDGFYQHEPTTYRALLFP